LLECPPEGDLGRLLRCVRIRRGCGLGVEHVWGQRGAIGRWGGNRRRLLYRRCWRMGRCRGGLSGARSGSGSGLGGRSLRAVRPRTPSAVRGRGGMRRAIAGRFGFRQDAPGCAHARHQTAGADLRPLGLATYTTHTLVNVLGYPPCVVHADIHFVRQPSDFRRSLPDRFQRRRQIPVDGVTKLFKTAGGTTEFDYRRDQYHQHCCQTHRHQQK